jgi:hypothetical protein
VLQSIYAYPYYPGYPNPHGLFSEVSTGVLMLPVFFNIEEHHRICHCPLSSACSRKEENEEGNEDLSSYPRDGCGVIPTPLPSVYPPKWMRRFVDPTVIAVPNTPESAESEAGNEDPSAASIFGTHFPERSTDIAFDDADVSLPNDNTRTTGPFKFIRQAVDYSMSNSWFPGESIPSVSFVKRKAAVSLGFGGERKAKRDEIVFAVRDVVDRQGQQGDWRTVDGKCVVAKEETASAASSSRAQTKSYVYETHDPKRPSAHDEEKCQRCAEIRDMRESERRRENADALAVRRLEEAMRDVPLGRRIEVDEEDEAEDEEDDDDDDERMMVEPLDVESFGFSPFGTDNPTPLPPPSHSRSPTPDSSSSSSSLPCTVLGDDLPHGEPPLYTSTGALHASGTRRVFDRNRVCAPEGCGGGVRDVVVTGETDVRHAVWHRQRYVIYGRVRWWDGLVGFLRVDRREVGHGQGPGQQAQQGGEEDDQNPLSHMFICGYVVNEKNFVGEWRMAASDPLKPAWGGPVLMTKRDGEEVPCVGGVAR